MGGGASCSSPDTSGTLVSAGEAAPLLQLVGHPDAMVRRRLVSLLRPSAQHTALLECRTDTLASRDQLATTLVGRLAEMTATLPTAHLDTFFATLSAVAGVALPAPAPRQLLTTLLGLYCAPASNVVTYARALHTLKAALSTVVVAPTRLCNAFQISCVEGG